MDLGPAEKTPEARLTLIVPYRDRYAHLVEFVPHMEKFLDHNFRLLIIQQADDRPFNKGALLNIGFKLARANPGWIGFHDIDLLPMDQECDYSEPRTVRHLAGAVEQFDWTSPYDGHVGGVLVIRPHIFSAVNGFSNQYWGWGCEDDDFFLRLWAHRVRIERRPGRYRSLPHPRAAPGGNNRHLLNQVLASVTSSTHESPSDMFRSDGLSSLAFRLLEVVPLHASLGLSGSCSASHQLVRVALE